MKPKTGFGECPGCHVYGVVARVSGIKPPCRACLRTVRRLLQGGKTHGQ